MSLQKEIDIKNRLSFSIKGAIGKLLSFNCDEATSYDRYKSVQHKVFRKMYH
ncbi:MULTISPECIES: hypothetical protein [unclassified Bartonella]|uniref:hypothetical protein n=1 Tax=unclassified Bartonella TaxID=2645622 RepID=UPI0035CFC2AC